MAPRVISGKGAPSGLFLRVSALRGSQRLYWFEAASAGRHAANGGGRASHIRAMCAQWGRCGQAASCDVLPFHARYVAIYRSNGQGGYRAHRYPPYINT